MIFAYPHCLRQWGRKNASAAVTPELALSADAFALANAYCSLYVLFVNRKQGT